MTKILFSLEHLIGGTPLVELRNFSQRLGLRARILGKLEYFNPAGSVKDRVAKYMLDEAEQQGKLKAGSVIIEPTSGNTGIGLAAVAAVRGYRTIIVMPDSMSKERQLLMKAYGAEVVLTEGARGMAGAIAKAEELSAQIPDSFIPSQFDNPANPKAHRETTGPEIYEDTNGKLDIFVAGIGTGGTVTGVGEYLKKKNHTINVVGVEPAASPFLTKGKSGSHRIQGIGAGFCPAIFRREVCDEIVAIGDEAAYEMARCLGRTEGILVGVSSGAALWAAVSLAKRPENAGKTIVVLLPDGGDRYLSAGLFEE